MIDSVSFFDSLSHTLVTFEVSGSGDPVVVGQGNTNTLAASEYSAQGFAFDQDIGWVNDAGESFDAAQAIGGSLDISIPGALFDDFRIEFSTPARAFGFWVVNNNSVSEVPTFTALDYADQVIQTVAFVGTLVDGTVGVADYGFMGISSDIPIAAVRVTKLAASFDDFYFIEVPEPSSVSLVLVGFARALVRRRRPSRSDI